MVEEVAQPIGYVVVDRNNKIHRNTNNAQVIYVSWGMAVKAMKQGYGRRRYEADELRVIPVFA